MAIDCFFFILNEQSLSLVVKFAVTMDSVISHWLSTHVALRVAAISFPVFVAIDCAGWLLGNLDRHTSVHQKGGNYQYWNVELLSVCWCEFDCQKRE